MSAWRDSVMDSLPARHSSGGRKQGLSCACLRAKSRKSREYLKMTKPEAVVTGKVTENQRKILEEILKDEHIIAKEVVCFINTPQRIFTLMPIVNSCKIMNIIENDSNATI